MQRPELALDAVHPRRDRVTYSFYVRRYRTLRVEAGLYPNHSLLPGYDMEMKVRCFLSTVDPVVLERKYSEGLISLDERLCDSLGRDHYGPAFMVREIEQRRDMSTSDDATLADFELPRIDHGQCMFAFVYDRPSFFATCHPFTKIARISYGKFDHLPSPIKLVCPKRPNA